MDARGVRVAYHRTFKLNPRALDLLVPCTAAARGGDGVAVDRMPPDRVVPISDPVAVEPERVVVKFML